MAVISVRLNGEEEKMVEYLSSYYEEEKSTLIKHSLKEMFEDLVDNEVIKNFEESEMKKKPVFIDSNNALSFVTE